MKLMPKAVSYIILIYLISSPVYCYTTHPELTVAGGYSQVNFNNINFSSTPIETDTLHPTNTSSSFLGLIGVSQNFLFDSPKRRMHDLSVGLNLYNLSFTNKGKVYQFSDASLDNFNYQMPIRSTRLMIDGKVTACPWHTIMPFLIGGVGMAWNRVKYYDSPTIDGVTGISLVSREQLKFSYEIGTGIQVALSKSITVFTEYLYANLGDIKSSTYGNTSIVGAIKSPLYVNSGLLGVNFSF